MQLAFIRDSIGEIIPFHRLAKYFKGDQLKVAIEGEGIVDVQNLISSLNFNDENGRKKEVFEWLLTILQHYNQKQLRQWLRFVTGTPQVPVGGFRQGTAIKVSVNLGQENKMPRAATCFSTFYLTNYTSQDELAKLLRFSIQEAEGLED